MPLLRRSNSGYRGVRVRPSSMFYAEIRPGDVCLGRTSTYDAIAAHAYDVAAWRLSRPRSQMNFNDARTCQHVQDLTPPSRLVTDLDCHEQRRRQRRLLITEVDGQAMLEWCQRYP
ncbi:Glutathione S-transferase DHAR2 [Hordeum vulgare]|nr:Glutathione S-transferase DHAR2 [Hordeum vulgare]